MSDLAVLQGLLVVLSLGLATAVVLGVIDELDPDPIDLARFLHLMSGDTHDH